MALTRSDQCGDARSRPAPKKPLPQRLIVALTTAGLIFAPLALSTWQRALQHGLAPSLYLVNHSGCIYIALTEIIIAFAVAPALVYCRSASLRYPCIRDPTPPSFTA